ncbi:MAG: SusF/SusE family outer membrane protein, partial [Alloprevotella sp.]
MKLNKILSSLAIMTAALLGTACDDEKDLVVIEGNLPIKTSTLFMVGDATPNGWNIDAPTELTASEADPLIFEWEGALNPGEMKLCLTPGSWDAPFIRPVENGTEIGKSEIKDAAFQMHAGDPDEKWRVAEAGIYHLTFDLRNWTMSTAYVGGKPTEPIVPIEAENLYIVGDATPNGWNIDSPTQLVKESQYIFTYEGVLNAGEFKACTSTG